MRQANGAFPSSIFLYVSRSVRIFDIEEIKTYLKALSAHTVVEVRQDIFTQFSESADSSSTLDVVAREFATSRVHNVDKPLGDITPLAGEISYEKRRLSSQETMSGVVYDAYKLQALHRHYLPPQEENLSYCHIIFTDQRIASYDENDKRYHLRVCCFGFPNVIAPSGIVEALAKPREHYLRQQMGFSPQGDATGLIDYEDGRMVELLKGYSLQALFYHIYGEAFCEDAQCRLYNAHWQEDALGAQLSGDYELCRRHTQMLENWKD